MKSPAAVATKLSPRKSYPWDHWTRDDKTRRYVQGEHFDSSPRQFAIMCHNYGRRHGFTVVTQLYGDNSVDIRFIKQPKRSRIIPTKS